MRLCMSRFYLKSTCPATAFARAVVFYSSFAGTPYEAVELSGSGPHFLLSLVEQTRLRLSQGHPVTFCPASRMGGLSSIRSVVTYDTVRHFDSSPASLLLRSLTLPSRSGGVGYSTYASKCVRAVFGPEIGAKQAGVQ